EPVDIAVIADSTSTTGDVARHIAAADPARSILIDPNAQLTLAVAPPTGEGLEPLQPDIPIGEAPIGSGFAAAVRPVDNDRVPAAHDRKVVAILRVVDGPLKGQSFPLAQGYSFIGRVGPNDVVLPDGMVSKKHARLEVSTSLALVDLNSTNGVYVDGEQA